MTLIKQTAEPRPRVVKPFVSESYNKRTGSTGTDGELGTEKVKKP